MTATIPSSMSRDEALHQAIAFHHAGKLQDAEQLYRAILQALPNDPDANHNLGVIAVQVKQPAGGLPHFKIAVETNPGHGQYWLSYIDAQLQAGQIDAARHSLEQARQSGLSGETLDALDARLQVEVNQPGSQETKTLLDLFHQGLYLEAATYARELTEKHPQHRLSWIVLGTALKFQGHGEDAVFPMQYAAKLSPDDAEVHSNLGILFKDLGRTLEAEASFRQALSINPEYAEAHNNMGTLFKDTGRLVDAEACYLRALEIKPEFVDAYYNLGNVQKKSGKINDALKSFHRALEIKPDIAETHLNLGNIYKELGNCDAAISCYRRAIEISPDFAEAHYNLGNTLKDTGQFEDAITSYRRAVEIKPDYADAWGNMGAAQQDSGQIDRALSSYRRALEINPDSAETYNNMGFAFQVLGQFDKALEHCNRALEKAPALTAALSNSLLLHHYLNNQSASMRLDEAKHFGAIVNQQALPFLNWDNVPDHGRCLRVGIVSGDLRNHSVGYFIEGMLAALVSKVAGQMEFVAYLTYFGTDALSERIKACCHGWRSVIGLSDESLCRQIRDDDIDILIDLSGHTAHNRLPMFAWKPAPVQASWLGYFATTGVAAIDYFIADPWTAPDNEEKYFTEKIWRLPNTYLCFTPPDIDMSVATLPAATKGQITFGCFNNLAKINASVVTLWSQVLLAVPGSHLFLKTKQLEEASARNDIVDQFAVHGVDASRLILESFSPRAELLASYARVDIALDPFPYPGGTTSVEALWMGVPVLTLAGDHFLSRIGECIMQNAGLPEWIAADCDDYVKLAVNHSADLLNLSLLRKRLRKQVQESPIFDAQSFAVHFESALRGMWSQWCNQQKGRQS